MAYYPDAYLRLLPYQALHLGTLHSEYNGGLHGPGEGLPQAVRGEGHLPEDRACVYHFQGELPRPLAPVEAHPSLLEDEELAALFPGGVEGFAFLKAHLGVLMQEDPYLLLGERLEEIHLREQLYLFVFFSRFWVLLAHPSQASLFSREDPFPPP